MRYTTLLVLCTLLPYAAPGRGVVARHPDNHFGHSPDTKPIIIAFAQSYRLYLRYRYIDTFTRGIYTQERTVKETLRGRNPHRVITVSAPRQFKVWLTGLILVPRRSTVDSIRKAASICLRIRQTGTGNGYGKAKANEHQSLRRRL